MTKTPLLDGLMKYNEEKILRFHMPGHYGKMPAQYEKLYRNLFALDVTEVDGTDNLAEPTGIILESLERIAEIYGAKKSYFLVNGSTSGIHIAMDALIPEGKTVVVGRNSHKSIRNLIRKKSLDAVYIYPRTDELFGVDSHIELQDVISAIEQASDVCAVVLTYPNYYGRTYDLKSIHDYLQSKKIPLIVDSAHGASFAFSKELPESAVLHSDICIHSLHKTLPAFTQTSLLHIGKNLSEAQIEKVEENLRFYLSSSPSYLLMASAELSVSMMEECGEAELLRLKKLYERACAKLESQDVPVYKNALGQDFCKLFVKTSLGKEAAQILRREYRIQCEMAVDDSLLFMLGTAHSEEDIDYLTGSILDAIRKYGKKSSLQPMIFLPKMERVSRERMEDCKNRSISMVDVSESIGLVIAEDIVPYPPGIPVVMEYEEMNEQAAQLLQRLGINKIKCFTESNGVGVE